MPILIMCDCGARLRARDELAGKTTKCPKCGQVQKIPGADAPTPAARSARSSNPDAPAPRPHRAPEDAIRTTKSSRPRPEPDDDEILTVQPAGDDDPDEERPSRSRSRRVVEEEEEEVRPRKKRKKKRDAAATSSGSFFGPERAGIQMGVLGGVLMMVIAAVWFFVGLAFDLFFPYPIVLFFIGIFAFFKGLATGNLSG